VDKCWSPENNLAALRGEVFSQLIPDALHNIRMGAALPIIQVLLSRWPYIRRAAACALQVADDALIYRLPNQH
jgi:hypothetical protein